jgi:sugar lactone lactonase YvrE
MRATLISVLESAVAAAAALAVAGAPSGAALAGEVLYATEGNRLLRVDLEAPGGPASAVEVVIERASDGETGGAAVGRRRDVNGMICPLPGGSGRFVAGEDTGQPGVPPGWGVFSPDGVQIGKLTATYRAELGEPFGCAFDGGGRLFTSSVGNKGFGRSLGQLILWFPPYDRFPGPPGAYPDTNAASESFCKLATDIGTAGAVAVDADGRIYVASSSRGAILRFSPPFPTSPDAAGGCGAKDELGSPLADPVQREVFARGLYTFSGLAFGPGGHLYAASVLTGEIVEIGADGDVVRKVLDPPGWLPPLTTGHPQGIAFDAAGSLYFADLDLTWDFPGIGPGPNGKLRRIRFDAEGRPQPPETLLDGLEFPDGVAVLPDGLGRAPAAGRNRVDR